jgi:hypothetical protein
MGLSYRRVFFIMWDVMALTKITLSNLAREVVLGEVPGSKFGREGRNPILAFVVLLSSSRQIPRVFYQILLSCVLM